jgi:hypothetical protein
VTQLVFGALAFATSPLGVLQLAMILAQMPFHVVRTVVGFFAPWIFYKDLSGETILITVSFNFFFAAVYRWLAAL